MTGTQMSQAYNGTYQTKHEHPLDGAEILRSARDALESAGVYFGAQAIADAQTRARYADGIRRMSEMVQDEVNTGNLTAAEGAAFCQQMRNRIMEETRKATSPQALPFAQAKKQEGRPLEWLLDRYSKKLFSKPFSDLSTAERDRAYFAVIEAAGRDNAQVTVKVARLRVAGKVGILITAALAAHEVIKAKDKMTEFARQGTIIEGGVLGGFIAGLGVSSVCGPAAPVCAIAVLLIGSTAGSIATEMAFDAYEHELKEFQAWRMR
jgi:hypothetical protein